MALYAIADTHLSFGTNKPMDSFPGWKDYVKRIEINWNNLVTENDTVVIAGDISWAINFEELRADFDFLNNLNGTKIISKGNHDYWWTTLTKMNAFLKENDFNTIKFLFNNSYEVDGVSVCGSRGWFFDSEEAHDEKILLREVNRIKTSIDSATSDEKIVFLHYPPVTTQTNCQEIVTLLIEKGIKKCYYGHLHGGAAKYALNENINGIDFELISADNLKFTPKLIKR
ncbi:MAG: metallophosphoesterase [Eubacterium sp.]|nr:metallophosphoesterase [Eubacterium sp.]